MSHQGAKKRRTPGSLKEAETLLIAACGGLERAHRVTLLSTSQLGRYTDPQDDATHMPVHVMRALETACGDPIVSRYLAASQGMLLVPLAEPDETDAKKLLIRVVRESAAFIAQATGALGNGGVDMAEAGKLLSPTMKLSAGMGMLARVLTALVERGTGGRK